MRRPTRLLSGLLLVLVAVSGGYVNANAQTTTEEADRIYATVQRPTNMVALLRNLKTAIDTSILLRSDFYTEPNIRNFFGANAVTWNHTEPPGKSGAAYDFEPLVSSFISNGHRFPGLSLFFWWKMENTGDAESTLGILVNNTPHADYEDVQLVFGTHWELAERQLLSPHAGPTPPATAPLGNDRIYYKIIQGRITGDLLFDFSSDAVVRQIGVHMKSIHQ